MIVYLNMKSSFGTETVDEINSNDFNSFKEFREEKNRLTIEYRLSGMPVYQSQKATKEWRKNNISD